MRIPLRLWLTVIALAGLHFLLRLGLSLGDVAPDLATVATLLAARSAGMGWGAGLGFFFGLLEDAFTTLGFGANAVAMTVVGALGGATRDLFIGDSRHFFLLYFSMGKWGHDVLHWLIAGDGMRGPFVDVVLIRAPVAALYAAAVGLVIVALSGVEREAGA